MKLFATLAFLACVRADFGSLRRVQETPCLATVDDINFSTPCSTFRVLRDVSAALQGLNCPHDATKEAMLLTDTSTARAAKQALKVECEGAPVSEGACLDLEDLSFPLCTGDAILDYISRELRQVRCSHNSITEAMLLTDTNSIFDAMPLLNYKCEPCTDIGEIIEANFCDAESIIDAIDDALFPCFHEATLEVQLLTGTTSLDAARAYIENVCAPAVAALWPITPLSSFSEIDDVFTPDFLLEYTQGGTFLNTETGNFQRNEILQFPTEGDEYGTREIGANIAAFRGDEATNTIMKQNAISGCQNQAIMCCFGRDRQSNDNNGNCAATDCVDADPADNSNLCYVEDPGTGEIDVFPRNSEGEIHCHGIAWADDLNHPSYQFKDNNWFYVSLYDHMYSRGYVESSVDKSFLPMCGCIEDMPPVSRSDCTEIDVNKSFFVSRDSADGYLSVALSDVDDLEVEFNSCQGIDANGRREDNDLASYVNKLVKYELLSTETQDEIFQVLVGHAQPNNNLNEEACTAAVEKALGGSP